MDFSNVKALTIGEPYDAELEYLEFTGSQSLPVPNTGDYFDIDLQITGGASQTVFGNGTATRNRKFGTDASGYYAAMGNTSSQSSPVLGSVRKTVTAYAPKSADTNITVNVDGIAYTGVTNRGSSWSNITIGGNSTIGFGSFKLYGLQGYKIVRVGQVGCLYDPDTGNLIYPSTGTLVCGPDARVINRQEVIKISTSEFPWVPGARRIEYLEGDSVNNWINPDVTVTDDTEIELGMSFTPTSASSNLAFGGWTQYSIKVGNRVRVVAVGCYFRVIDTSPTTVDFGTSWTAPDLWTIDTPHKLFIRISDTTDQSDPTPKTCLYVDDAKAVSQTIRYSAGHPYYYALCQTFLSLAGGIQLRNSDESPCRLYWCKIWQGGTLVRDFVPIKVGTEGCLYDKVTGTVYHNPGTVPFICGAEVAETVLWKKPVPYDSEVEYLESDGNSYINTGIVGSSSIDIDSMWRRGTDGANAVLGSRIANADSEYGVVVFNDAAGANVGNVSWRFGTANQQTSYVGDGTITIVTSGSVMTANDVEIALQPQTFNSGYPISVFGLNNAGTTVASNGARLYYLKIYENGTLIRDFRPVRVGTTGYLFDRISWTLFGNAGTGNFGYGADVPDSW